MTIEEVRALIATPMQNEAVKQAYLFSCFCGLRISDIISLKWKDVFVDRGQYRLAVSMQKTKEPIYLPLSPEALKWMPERGEKTSEDHVFDLPIPTMINTLLKSWAKAAGIDKRFSFLTSRHTFATMMLTLGAPFLTCEKQLRVTILFTPFCRSKPIRELRSKIFRQGKVVYPFDCHSVIRYISDNSTASACRLYGSLPDVVRRLGY